MSVKNAHNTFLVFKNKLDTAQGSNLVDGKFIKKQLLKINIFSVDTTKMKKSNYY